MKIKIYVVGKSVNYARFIYNSELVDNINDANIILFTGGEDVTPSLYNEEANDKTYNDPLRDFVELNVFKSVNHDTQLCLGICRGSQLMCALSGGKLVQHCENHGLYGTHPVALKDGVIIDITSTHHQMMFPYNMDKNDYDIIGWSITQRSDIHESVEWKGSYVEPEIVYFKNSNSLGIQGHPEMMSDGKTWEVLNNIITNYLNK